METFMKEFEHLKIQLQELKAATDNFDKSKIIGSGGFGKVYAGKVALSKQGERLVAIKRLDRKFGQGDPEFWKEIMMLSRYSHQNLISLLGYCNDARERVLVYEHALNGSLDRHLSSTSLNWTERIRICLDAATGLCYLHDGTGTHQRVLHRDIKSSNILLDADWNAKISDMGLSKVGPANQHTALMTNVVGTPGYLDPMYLELNILTKESDVYSFGVVLFEVLCGRLCFEYKNGSFCSLVRMWKKSYTDNKLSTIIFQDLTQPMDPTALETFSDIAFQCLHELREDRPAMSVVVKQLQTALELQEPLDNLKIPEEYEKIVKAAATRIRYKSIEELKTVLSDGVFLNDGNTWLTLNHNEELYQMISIVACLIPVEDGKESSRFSFPTNSRFEKLGCYSTNGKKFKAHVRTKFLSPHVTYMVNLVFRFVGSEEANKPGYLPLKYIFEGDTKVSVVSLVDKTEDEMLIARLYQFTSDGDGMNVDLEFLFEDHEYCKGLDIDGIEFQPIKHVEHHQPLELEYEDILREVIPPVNYRSVKELKLLLSNGVLLSGGKTWFSINDNEERIMLTSIKECLIDANDMQYSGQYNSRFKAATYHTRGHSFKTRVKGGSFLSPCITYGVNLVFKCPQIIKNSSWKLQNMSIIFTSNLGERRRSIVYIGDKKEEEWVRARLNHFTTTSDPNSSIQHLVFNFEKHKYHLEVEGIEFQPLKIINAEEEEEELKHDDDIKNKYQHILQSVKGPPLVDTSVHELKLLLSKGTLVNDYNTWFYVNDKGQHYELISIKHCYSSEKWCQYVHDYDSRFPVGSLYANTCNFKVRVIPQFLTPFITYTVNLVFKFYHQNEVQSKQIADIRLEYKLLGHEKCSVSFLAHKRELDEWWMLELCQFTSDEQGTPTPDIEITFKYNDQRIVVEGIEFQPVDLEKEEEHQVLEDEKVDDEDDDEIQPPLSSTDSDSVVDTYWEQKLPIDYEDIIKLAKKDSVPVCTTKKDLYFILSKGFLMNDGQQWLSINKNGKKCLMLSPRAACVVKYKHHFKWHSSAESRFRETMELDHNYVEILREIGSELLTSETRYAAYLVYKLPRDLSRIWARVKVMDGRNLVSHDWKEWEKAANWYVYIDSPKSPVINVRNLKVDGNTCNPLNRPKIKDRDLPKQRSDSWIEVKVCEFQTPTTTATTNQISHIHLKLKTSYGSLTGLIFQGIEFRPV